MRNDNLLDLLESLLGPELTCNPIQHLRSKPPQAYESREGPSFHNVPWHQDAGVMMPEAEGSNVITCWLPLADAMVEHGCMEVLPGIGETGYLRHRAVGGTTIDGARDAEEALHHLAELGAEHAILGPA